MKTHTAILSVVVLGLSLAACGDGSQPATVSPIEQRIQRLFPGDPPFGDVDRAQVRQMLEVPPEEDGPFFMVNLIRHREHAEYPDGRETNLTGEQADGIYGSLILPILLDIGARPVFVANVEDNLIDADGAAWTQIGVVRYPSRAKFFDMLERQDFVDAAQHKLAGVEKTLVLVADIDGEPLPDALRNVDLSSIPYPPTADDQPIAIVHLLDYNDIAQYEDGRETMLTGREAMSLYETGRQDQNVIGLGVRPGLWLAIEGEVIGDGREWEEFRINNFPSRATFEAITTADSLDEAGVEHRVAALRETYTQRTAPLLTEVGYN